MQFSTSIPQDWESPKFWLGQRTEQGLIVGVEYCPPGTLLAEEYGDGWRYIVLPNKNSEELHSYFDDELKPLSTSKLQKVLQEELEQYQQRITTIQQQLAAIGGSNDG
ncbi:hypothetical protein IQ244_32165 [Nostoc sp. LEGE 06077]|uniref:hypothetical protein n=1 Tax=Nostoc sp. LEGE 06077 TaxID=915325 RepID=UPI001881272E|nr:hypothetical protein [Nostoc sp. LEGE 06077]MBE9211060.1 hypothetical protein [Nostoc sp. LEGE 06077]